MDEIAIISDIHGNYSALESVLKNIEERNIKNIICLGDLVNKCSNPDLVIEKLKEKCNIILKGNCDELVYNNLNYNWTRSKIGPERLEFLHSLPVSYDFYLSGHLIRLFHASPYNLESVYNPMFSNSKTKYKNKEIKNAEEMFLNTTFLNKTSADPIPDIVGYGHIHTPNIFRYKNKTLFNPGSVGVPVEMLNTDLNDKNNKFSTMASYIILGGELNSKELKEINFNLVRIPYDIEKEIKDLENSNMVNAYKVIRNLRTATYEA